MTDETPAAKPFDPLEIATAIGHGAAVNVLVALSADSEPDPTFDPQCWPSFGAVRLADVDRDPAGELARYVCSRDAAIAGETLYRKAAELGLHDGDADAWAGQPDSVRLAYELFIGSAWHAYRSLTARALPAPAPSRRAVDIEDQIFEQQVGIGDRDAVAVAALEQPAPSAEAAELDQAAEEDETDEPADPEAASDPAGEAVLSVGEPPIDMAKQVKRRGGKRTRSAS